MDGDMRCGERTSFGFPLISASLARPVTISFYRERHLIVVILPHQNSCPSRNSACIFPGPLANPFRSFITSDHRSGLRPRRIGSDGLSCMHTSDAAHEFALIDNGEHSCDIGTECIVHNGGHFACFSLFSSYQKR
jgi:hypothetical protein